MDAPRISRRKRIAFTATASILWVVLVEGVVRIALPRPGFEPSGLSMPGLLVPHPTRSYAYAPGFVGDVEATGRSVHVEINTRGLRDGPIVPGERVDILAAGDSFTAGWGIEAQDAWPKVLERDLRVRVGRTPPIHVVNAGVSGYSLRQIRLHVEDLLDLQPHTVALGLVPREAWRIRNPYVFHEGQAIMRSVVPRTRTVEDGYVISPFDRQRLQRVDFWLMRHLYTAAYLMHGAQRLRTTAVKSPEAALPAARSDDLDEMLDELTRLHDLLTARDIHLVVLLVNQQAPDGAFSPHEREMNVRMRSFCVESGIAVFDPLPTLDATASGKPIFRQADDFHWSSQAHAIVGHEFAGFLVEEHMAAF